MGASVDGAVEAVAVAATERKFAKGTKPRLATVNNVVTSPSSGRTMPPTVGDMNVTSFTTNIFERLAAKPTTLINVRPPALGPFCIHFVSIIHIHFLFIYFYVSIINVSIMYHYSYPYILIILYVSILYPFCIHIVSIIHIHFFIIYQTANAHGGHPTEDYKAGKKIDFGQFLRLSELQRTKVKEV